MDVCHAQEGYHVHVTPPDNTAGRRPLYAFLFEPAWWAHRSRNSGFTSALGFPARCFICPYLVRYVVYEKHAQGETGFMRKFPVSYPADPLVIAIPVITFLVQWDIRQSTWADGNFCTPGQLENDTRVQERERSLEFVIGPRPADVEVLPTRRRPT
jgi:hypothetical protein